MRRILPILIPILLLSLQLKAQIASWNFTGQNTPVATTAANLSNPGLTAVPVLTRGTGAAATNANNSFRTQGFKNDGISLSNTDYFQVQLTAIAGNQLSLTSITGVYAGTNTFIGSAGVTSQYAYSLDGINFTLIGLPIASTATAPGTIALSGIAALQNVAAGTTVTLKYFASGQTTTGGWGYNSPNATTPGLVIDGTVTGGGGNGGGDTTAPQNTANYPKTANITTSSLNLISNINEAGTTYYVVLPSGGAAPSPAQVKAGQDGNGSPALKSGSMINTATTDATANITGLASATNYTIYTVAQDAAATPNLQAAVTSLSATTLTVITTPVSSPIVISQYYEGGSINKWIELTNLSNSPVNTASPQLKLALYNISGDTGTINITGTPIVVNLTVTIPARGTVLIGNDGNAEEVPYLKPKAADAAQIINTVINFNGNDGVALLDANNNILDAFGQGINAKDASYVRNIDVTSENATYTPSEWTNVSIQTVQSAIDDDDINRLGVHFAPNLSPCVAPTVAPINLIFSAISTSSITGTFSASSDANEYLIIRSINSTLSAAPQNGVVYNTGTLFGGGTVVGRIVTNTFTDSSLPSSTKYYYFIFALNNTSCTGGPIYLSTAPLTGSQTTNTLSVCATPTAQPSNFAVTSSNYNFIQASYTPVNGVDEYLVVMSTSNSLTANPLDKTTYSVGDAIGGGIVVKRGVGATFTRTGLAQNTNYYFYIFSVNSSCSGGPLYLTATPLVGNYKTGILDANNLNFYYGNLHSHSSYSDGNKDDRSKKPEDDYAFAKNSMKMDFLGISEHNHTDAGMSLANWQPGIDAAKSATTPTFLALHGMEWGVISGGGHVIVYGIDSLIGWQAGENQIFVPKNTYTGTTGLFNIINRHGLNAIATLAHPNTTDYNNLSAAYNIAADSAIVGTALESGPATSTNITYSDPASSMSYLSYYNRMLAAGYHLGATIDHDNHNLTFGRHTRARLVVLAAALTENDILDAMKRMRFYASEDSAAKITFTIDKLPVGSIFKGTGAPVISINSATTSPVSSIKLMYGTPGSGVAPVTLTTSTNGTLSYTHDALANLASGYYYADITELDGSRIITSPIWYTRDLSFVKQSQNITFPPTRSVLVGTPDLVPGATSDHAETRITYTSSDASIATIVDDKIHILKAGTVTITASQEEDALFSAASKQQILTINPFPTALITASASATCVNNTSPVVTFTGTVGTAPYTFTYTLNGGSPQTITSTGNTATLAVSTANANTFVYTLLNVKDANANQAQTGTATVIVNALPAVQITTSKGGSVSKGESLVITASGGTQYQWTGADITSGQNSASITIRPKQSGNYLVKVTNASGCSIEQNYNILVVEDYKLEASSLITPNGDGMNDKFIVKNIDFYPNNTLKIFDKTGRVLYTVKSYANDWDGKVNGSPLAAGTYYYIIDMGTGRATFKGYINILRD